MIKRVLHVAFALFLLSASSHAATVVHVGEIREFNGPDDLDLDPGRVVIAVDSYGDGDRVVNGVTFRSDKGGGSVTFDGVTASTSASNNINDWASRPSYSGADQASVDNLEQIMQDIRWEAAPNPVSVEVTGLSSGIEYQLHLLFNEGGNRDRRWDIEVEGELAVDDMSSEGEGTWSSSNGFAYIGNFTLAPGDSTLNVEMAQHIGGQGAMGSDNNPILQAFVVTEVFIPPTPEELALTPTEFFSNQFEAIGIFETTDLKRNAIHLYSFESGAGATDNDKFEIDDNTLVPGAYDFSVHPPGTTFSVRVRTTDAEEPERFLDRVFVLTLAQPLPPTGVELSAGSVSLGAVAGTPVGQLTTIDPNAVDGHAYALVSGNGDTHNGLFSVDGTWIRLDAVIPDGTAEVFLRVRTTDRAGLSFEESFTLMVTEPSLRINELMASNGSTLDDEDNDSSDWIELFNEQTQTVNLNGWYLTDDPGDLTKWQFPAVNIGANGFLIVFASGKDRAPVNGDPLHANFQLGSGGEFLALVEADGETIASQIDFGDQFTDVAYGANPQGTEIGFLQEPTPNAVNTELTLDALNEVTFSHERGFYDEGFELTLTPTIEGSTIRYTTNGSKPTASSGSIYNGPISITPETGGTRRGTRRVRAIAVHNSSALAPVSTHTYLFINGTGANPETDGVVGQSVMRSVITDHPTYGPLIDDGLLAFPSVSIVKPSGINGSEEETSIEFFDPSGEEPGFQIDCGIKIVGGASVGSQKNNFRLYFRSEYGAPKLRYPLYANHPYTEGGSDTFDVLQLRSGSHDNFYWLALPSNPPVGSRHGDAQYIRNRWRSDMEMLMGHTSLHGRYVQVYLNGVYHGMYHFHERPMHHWMDKYFGGDPEDYHHTNSGRTGSDHGGGDSWSQTWNTVKNAASAGGVQSKEWINWENLADSQLLSYYAGNDWDWSSTHNWMAAGPNQPGEGGWRFFGWDVDINLQDVNNNNLGRNAPDGVFQRMMNDADFEVYFRDRVYKHCFNDGWLTPEKVCIPYDYRMNEIFTAIVSETARWQPNSSHNPPWDRDGEWQVEWDYMTNVFWPQRTGILINQLRSRGWYAIDAPEFGQRGGVVSPGYSPVISSTSGTIYVTTDGSDPRLPGGAINPNAVAHNGATTNVRVLPRNSDWKYLDDGSNQGTAWRESDFDDSAWASGPAELGYGDGPEATTVGFGGDPSQKFITTYFRTTFDVTNANSVNGLILRLRRDDGGVVYINGSEVWRENMPLGTINFLTPAASGVSGGGETDFFIKTDVDPAVLVEGENVVAVEIHQSSQGSSDISFDFELDVVQPTDPSLFSLDEATVVRTRALDGTEWSAINEARFYMGGPANAGNLAVTEISYRPSPPTAAEDPGGIYSRTDFEFVELMNISDATIRLEGVRFVDGIRFDFDQSLTLSLDPGQRVLLVENRDAFLARYPGVDPEMIVGEYDGNLSNDGEQIQLVGLNAEVIRDFTYNDKHPWPESADGDGFSLTLVSPGTNPDHADPLNWRPSVAQHGTPGGTDSVAFAGGGDAELLAYAFGIPVDGGPASAPDVSLVGGHLTLTFPHDLRADDVLVTVDYSENLLDWQTGPTAVEFMSQTNSGTGSRTQIWRAVPPQTGNDAQYLRVRVTTR